MHAFIIIIIVVALQYNMPIYVVQHWTIKVINTLIYCCIDDLPVSCANSQRIVQQLQLLTN